jgi:hypothetical protein
LGLAGLEGPTEASRIGLTEAGLAFARLGNHVLDEGRNAFPPLSEQENEFILSQLEDHCPREVAHMSSYLKSLRDHPNADRETVDRLMLSFYEQMWNPLNLSHELIDSTRGSVHSRCVELGLAVTHKNGKASRYAATERGLRWLSSQSIRQDRAGANGVV